MIGLVVMNSVELVMVKFALVMENVELLIELVIATATTLITKFHSLIPNHSDIVGRCLPHDTPSSRRTLRSIRYHLCWSIICCHSHFRGNGLVYVLGRLLSACLPLR